MCLISKNKYPELAKEDIIVYVVREVCIDLKTKKKLIISPYSYFEWELNKKYLERTFKINVKNEIDSQDEKRIHFGFHSFKYFSDAKKDYLEWIRQCNGHYKIFKAIIPKDSLYWTGKFNTIFKRNSYCSNQLKLIEEIDE
jgi:hypothetical protein